MLKINSNLFKSNYVHQVKDTQIEKEKAEIIEKERAEIIEKEKAEMLSRLSRDDDQSLGEMILDGAFLGAKIGGFIGLIYGYNNVFVKAANYPVKTITITYKQPLFENKEIGKIPRDQYVGNYGKVDLTPTEPVYRQAPVRDDSGQVVYKEYQQVFSGRGEPVVVYEYRQIHEPVFEGYSYYVIKDNNLGGKWIRFQPLVTYRLVDTYTIPHVRFVPRVNGFMEIMKGVGKGIGLGAVIGGAVGAIVDIISKF